jgi:hypothetical protein
MIYKLFLLQFINDLQMKEQRQKNRNMIHGQSSRSYFSQINS